MEKIEIKKTFAESAAGRWFEYCHRIQFKDRKLLTHYSQL